MEEGHFPALGIGPKLVLVRLEEIPEHSSGFGSPGLQKEVDLGQTAGPEIKSLLDECHRGTVPPLRGEQVGTGETQNDSENGVHRENINGLSRDCVQA